VNLNDPDFQKQLHRWSPTSSRWLDPDMEAIMRVSESQNASDWTPVIAKAETLGLPYAALIARRMREMQYDRLFLRELGIAPLGVE